MDVEELDTYIPLVLNEFEREKRQLVNDILYAEKLLAISEIAKKPDSRNLEDFVKQFALYGAYLTDAQGNIIAKAGQAQNTLSNAEKKTVQSAASSRGKSYTAVKDNYFRTSGYYKSN